MNISPKIQLLMNSEHAEKINSMLDAGKSANNVHKYLNSQGFSISLPTVYKYSDMRREGLLEKVRMTAQPKTDEGAQMSDMCGPYADDADDAAGARLLTELEALDALIEKGYKAITEMEPEEVTPKLMMDAIRLKNELTGGNHALLTGYGYSSLKALNDKKMGARYSVRNVIHSGRPQGRVPERRRADRK